MPGPRLVWQLQLAGFLNKQGTTTGAGNPWTRTRVRSLRALHDIPPYDPETGGRYISLREATALTGASSTLLRSLMSSGELPCVHVCKGAKIELLREDLTRPEIVEAIERRQARRGRKAEPHDAQLHLSCDRFFEQSGPISSTENEKPHDSKPVVR